MKYLEKEHNWNIHVKNIYGSDAYLIASYYGKLEIMKYLEKEHNWDIYVKNYYGETAYSYAKLEKHNEIIKHLENKMFYDKLSKLVNEFVELKDKEINKLTQKINLINNFLEKS
jgi:ankyrin repeat protein